MQQLYPRAIQYHPKELAPTRKLNDGLQLAPLPGVVKQILVKEGDLVEKGQILVILEAMKMENEIQASCAGRVSAIYVDEENTVVKEGALLLHIGEV